MIRTTLSATLLLAAAAVSVQAAQFPFIPPNDPTGQVFTTNSNDGYSGGRGDVFSMQQNTTIDSVGLYHDLTNTLLSFNVAQVTSTTGQVTTGQTVLRSGSATVSTNGLQWIDFPIVPLTLLQGNNYHIEFSFPTSGNQNFFYNNGNAPFTTGNFTLVDGTQGGNATNFVMPAERVDIVPEPSSLILLGFAALGLFAFRKRKA